MRQPPQPLATATLQAMTTQPTNPRPTGDPVTVQFNPTTLRLAMQNSVDMKKAFGKRPATQYDGTSSSTLSFDLVFDTADEGSTGAGVSVLEKTKSVERFVRPKGAGAGQEAPPRVVFVWGRFLVQGTMESANIDLDLFDADGVPLRAKVAVSIKGQDPRWTYTPAPAATPPAGAGAPAATPATGLPPGAPGTQGNGLSPSRIVQALPGESLAQLAARAGFDPAAWRALASGLANPLKLSLGQEIPLPPGGSRGAATGSATQGSDPGRTTAALPLVAPQQAPAGGAASPQAARPAAASADPVRQGQAVAQSGGVQKAIAQVKDTAHQQGAAGSLGAFGHAAVATADASERPWGVGVPLRPRFGGRTSRGQAIPRPPSPRPPRITTGHGCGCGCAGCQGKH